MSARKLLATGWGLFLAGLAFALWAPVGHVAAPFVLLPSCLLGLLLVVHLATVLFSHPGVPVSNSLQCDLADWARESLPVGANHLAKFKEEVRELLDAPSDADEMADVCLALMLHADQHGIDLLEAASRKFEAVKSRAYGPCDEQGVSRHV